MAVPDNVFMKRLKNVGQYVQWKEWCCNTAVIDGLSVCLFQKCLSGSMRIFSRLCMYFFINKSIFGWLVMIPAFWNNELGVYAIF